MATPTRIKKISWRSLFEGNLIVYTGHTRTFGTHTMKQRCAHWLVGLASGAGGGNVTLENVSFDGPTREFIAILIFGMECIRLALTVEREDSLMVMI